MLVASQGYRSGVPLRLPDAIVTTPSVTFARQTEDRRWIWGMRISEAFRGDDNPDRERGRPLPFDEPA
jgi:hypothetical protein